MRIETITKKIYTFKELSAEAQEKIKEWYLNDDYRVDNLLDTFNEDLYNIFGVNNLKVQFSLSYCQGDGVNIYGIISVEQFLNAFPEKFSDEEKATLLEYAGYNENIELPMNRRYCFPLIDKIDIADRFTDLLEYYGIDANYELLRDFENYVKKVFTKLCNDMENIGYDYLYEMEKDELQETCEANDWEFLEDGTFWG